MHGPTIVNTSYNSMHVYRNVEHCIQECGTLYTGMWNTVYRNVEHCIQECATLYTGIWNTVYRNVEHCIQECGTLYTGMWNTVYRNVEHCINLGVHVDLNAVCVRRLQHSELYFILKFLLQLAGFSV